MNRTINLKSCIATIGIGLFLVFSSLVWAGAVDELPTINSPILRIRYQVSPEIQASCPQVALWYRVDQGKWEKDGVYKTGDPIEFATGDDGIYELSVMPANSQDPDVDGIDHAFSTFKCLVDYNKPVVQIINATIQDNSLTVRWRAFDKHFSDRPIEIYLVNRTRSTLLGRFANHGVAVVSVDPEKLPGRIKIIAIDKAGNYTYDVSKRIEVVTTTSKPATTQPVKKEPQKEVQAIAVEPEGPVSTDPNALREYRLGVTYRSRGDLDLACVHLKRATEYDRKMTAAFIDLADVFSTLGRYNDATEMYLQAIVLNDRSLKAWQGLGMIRVQQGQYQQAMFCLEKVVEMDDKNVQGWLYLGDAYWTLGQRKEAKNAWLKAKDVLNPKTQEEFAQNIESRLIMAK